MPIMLFFMQSNAVHALNEKAWGHNIVLLDKVADMDERKWYIKKSAENGWSRNVLVHQIESNLYQRQVLADKVTNFEHRLPSPQSELAVQTIFVILQSESSLLCSHRIENR